MSFYHNNAIAGASGNQGGYEIDQSLRFNPADSARLYRTLAASQTRTYSFWYKYANLSGGNMYLFHHKNSGDTNYLGVRSGGSPSENQWQTLNQGSSFTEIASSRKYRDPSAWQHVVWKCTSTNVTMYVNGVEFASAGGANASLSGGTLEIGARGSAEYFGGYIAEFHFVDGTAYNPSDFGETDLITGAWIPKRFGGTYGANGVYLKFDPAATNGIGHDHSGNGNNFTASGFTTSGTGTDVMSDTPTTNWCTFNPLDKASAHTLSDGNLKITQGSTTDNNTASTIAVSSGKWYFELEITNHAGSTSYDIGIGKDLSRNTVLGNNATSYAYSSSGNKRTNGTNSSYGASFTTGDILGAAFDADAGTLTFYKNGTSQGEAFTGITNGPYHFLVGTYNSGDVRTANFGQRAFAYTPPTGYKALNTANLPEPTIKDGGKHFNAITYTGTGGSQVLNSVGFQSDFIWIKSRSNAKWNLLVDVVRGFNKWMASNATDAEYTEAHVSDVDSDGYTVNDIDSGTVNELNYTYVGWNWKANGAGSSNTAGTITSTVSANPSAGFSIVTYTGTGNAASTVGHGLGVVPAMIITKRRDNTGEWMVKHQSLASNLNLILNQTSATYNTTIGSSGGLANLTSSTTFGFVQGSSNTDNSNANGGTFVAYCFSEVAGYSKFGSYVGNGSSDGPFVFTGFKIAWLMWKRTDSTANWFLMDAARNTYNVVDKEIYPDRPDAENTFTDVDFLSNGFKLRASAADRNASGGTFVYAAFAELPFKYSTAR